MVYIERLIREYRTENCCPQVLRVLITEGEFGHGYLSIQRTLNQMYLTTEGWHWSGVTWKLVVWVRCSNGHCVPCS